MSHVQFVTGILLISSKQKIVKAIFPAFKSSSMELGPVVSHGALLNLLIINPFLNAMMWMKQPSSCVLIICNQL